MDTDDMPVCAPRGCAPDQQAGIGMPAQPGHVATAGIGHQSGSVFLAAAPAPADHRRGVAAPACARMVRCIEDRSPAGGPSIDLHQNHVIGCATEKPV
jgi:hypothetical protein